MRNSPHGPVHLLKFGPLPLALVAVAVAPSGQAQIRTRTPVALPTPTPSRIPDTGRIRRAPGIEAPTPSPTGPSAVYLRQDREQAAQAEEPSDDRPVRGRRPRGDDTRARTGRDPFEAEPDTSSESVPVRSRRIPVEATPSERDPAPVRTRRTPVEERYTDQSETTPVRSRRIPVEATPLERDPAPVRTRRTPVEERYTDQSETTPVRSRRIPVEATPLERDPTPVRTRRTPVEETYTDEATPVRPRRIPVEATPPPRDSTPVRQRRIPVEEFQDSPPLSVPPARREITPVRRAPPQPPFDGTFSNIPRVNPPRITSSCGGQAQQPLTARIRRDDFDSAVANITPPSDAATVSMQDSLTLRAGSHADLMNKLPTLRQIPASVLNGASTVTIGKTRVDFRPMVQNPKALVNIAKKLRALPTQVEVCADVLEAMEIKQGLVVRSLLTYRILPGACRDEERRAKLAGSGVSCFTRSTVGERESGFSNVRNIRYVRDPGDRAKALAASRLQASKVNADIDQSVADFHRQLNDPAQRAEIAEEIGDAELVRLGALDDSALAGELANAAETKVEQIAFIPKADDTLKTFKPLGVPISAIKPPPPPVDIDYDIGNYVFLAGFTLGKQYEWKQRVDTTIKWCFVGCKKHYYAELFAGFEYGFGLRIPIAFGGTYNPSSAIKDRATLTVKLAPIDGSVADYKAAGLADNKLYEGKELVAEVWAHAGASAKLPIVGVLGPVVPIQIGQDFTDALPAPLAHGQWTPPTPGVKSSEPEIVHVFEDVDLIGGRANFGILGGKLLPAVKVTLHSEKMRLTLKDSDGQSYYLTSNGQVVNVAVDPYTSSSFTVGDPFYTLGFNVTPGITARLFIDLAVWSNNWDWPIWFPQLAVDLPPGGIDFACHEGTVCTRKFGFNQNGAQTEFARLLEKWAREFDPLWIPKCVDEPCKLGIRFIRQGVLFSGRHKLADNPDITIAAMKAEFINANINAQKVVTESLARKAEAASNSWGVIAQAIWTKQCKDALCYDTVTALAAQMGTRARAIAKANPSQSSLWVTQQVNKEFVPQFRQAVDDSVVRDATEQSFEMQRQLKKQKLKTPKLQ
ncbi:MAG: hypothetical protein WC729_05050 [Sphingomonas sp.]|jgi:hypothetical protein|uniref:hypothetical protein n=1 Tax=Sphingomonas sp. TaxID=28214 RepID=UPI0035665101